MRVSGRAPSRRASRRRSRCSRSSRSHFSGQTTTTNGLTGQPTDFFYLEVSANAFGDGNPITKPPGSDFLALFSPEGPPPRARAAAKLV